MSLYGSPNTFSNSNTKIDIKQAKYSEPCWYINKCGRLNKIYCLFPANIVSIEYYFVIELCFIFDCKSREIK